MFRPYNLKSITAWTVGSLAGNQAYYSVKTRSAGPRISPASSPASVRALIKRLQTIEQETQTIKQRFSSLTAEEGKLDLTPIVQVKVYRDWFPAQREAIMDEIARTYSDTMAAGYLWPPNIIKDVQKALQEILKALDNLADSANNAFQLIVKSISDPQEKQVLMDTVLKWQARYRVSSKTWRLLKPRNDNRLIVSIRDQAPTKPVAAASPQPRKWQGEMKCPNCASRIGFNLDERGTSFTCQCGTDVVLW